MRLTSSKSERAASAADALPIGEHVPASPGMSRRKRATILLMVVSILALLVVIVIGFLSLARSERATQQDTRRGNLADQAVENANSLLSDRIAGQIQSGSQAVTVGSNTTIFPGGTLAGGDPSTYSAEDIPGYGFSNYIRSLDPVWQNWLGTGSFQAIKPTQEPVDYTDTAGARDWDVLEKLFWPAETSLDASKSARPNSLTMNWGRGGLRGVFPTHRWLAGVPENDLDNDNVGDLNGDGIQDSVYDVVDTKNYAQNPHNDSDGDGIPDADFLGGALLTDLANAAAGLPVEVRGSGIRFSGIPNLNATTTEALRLRSLWQSFNDQARFEVATGTVSHGGMVSLYAPSVRESGVMHEPFNRDFVLSLFDQFRNSADTQSWAATWASMTKADRDFLMDELAASAAVVDANLRNRGGLLAAAPALDAGEAFGGAGDVMRRVPPILAVLQGESSAYGAYGDMFSHTFIPYFPKLGALPSTVPTNSVRLVDAASNLPDSWSPINLAETRLKAAGSSERSAAARALAVDPIPANDVNDATGSTRAALAQRRAITTINNSDEIARKQVPGEPIVSTSTNASYQYLGLPASLNDRPLTPPTTPQPGTTYQGELKFWLGECAKAYEPVVNGGSTYRYNPIKGQIIVERLTRLFYDMLDSTDPASWENSVLHDYTVPATGDNEKEVVLRRQQAIMLAVNTLGFMAPRDSSGTTLGWIDPPYYRALTSAAAGTGIEYIGYTPQPFMSEVVAYSRVEGGPTGMPTTANTEVAVELFNPHDPFWTDATAVADVFGLPLNQYALSINGANPNLAATNWKRLDQLTPTLIEPQINGRSFRLAVVRDGTTSAFSGAIASYASPIILDGGFMFSDTDENLKVTLWKAKKAIGIGVASLPERWFPVDEVELKNPLKEARDNQDTLDSDGDGQIDASEQWYSAYRDTSPTRYFGVDLDRNGVVAESQLLPDRYARWNVVSAYRTTNGGNTAPDENSLRKDTAEQWLSGTGTVVDPDAIGATDNFAPTSPLITMNAGPVPGRTLTPFVDRLNNLPMFGNPYDLRPRSFPSVGFMLYVPRYSHAWALQFTSTDGATLMTETNPLENAVLGSMESARKPMSATLAKEAIQRYGFRPTDATPNVGPYPLDFGHMPLFDNRQKVRDGSYLASVGNIPWGQLVFDYFTTLNPNGVGVDPLRVPGRININTASWLMLSYLPMMGPVDVGGGDLQLMLRAYSSGGTNPIVTRFPAVTVADPSPSFWDERVGVLNGFGEIQKYFDGTERMGNPRLIALDRSDLIAAPITSAGNGLDYLGPGGNGLGRRMPWGNPAEVSSTATGRYHLGPWFALSAASYRDGVPYLPTAQPLGVRPVDEVPYANAYLRNWASPLPTGLLAYSAGPFYGLQSVRHGDETGAFRFRPYRDARPVGAGANILYGAMRGQLTPVNGATGMPDYLVDADASNNDANESPTQYGFVSIGELLNVKGWDSSRHDTELSLLSPSGLATNSVVTQGDFVKAVSAVSLLDSQYLTTRSNTFTIYVSVTDRRDPQQSVRSQMTVDRSNLLPRLKYGQRDLSAFGVVNQAEWPLVPIALDTNPATAGLETPQRVTPTDTKPEVVSQRRGGYFNSRYSE